ncbi:MAG: S9 family peptidase, partial [Methyloligellaceae bacterium]
MTSTPPVAEKRPHTDTHHGMTRTDDYAWLRADNWQEVMRDPGALPTDIRAYLEAENTFTETTLSATETLQEKIFEELKGRIKQDDSSVPSPHGPWAYYSSFVTGGEYPRICREPRGGGKEQILLDGNAMGEGLSYFSLGGASH